MSMTPKRTWKRMVVAADMKYMVFRPKLWMYFATSKVETSLKMSEEVETVHMLLLRALSLIAQKKVYNLTKAIITADQYASWSILCPFDSKFRLPFGFFDCALEENRVGILYDVSEMKKYGEL